MKPTTRTACVIGYPARHSLSPKLHGYWLAHYGINGIYRIEEIAPENFEEFVMKLSDKGYVGANVTMPHKYAAFKLALPDNKAQAIGAANTLWLDGDVLRATNTDGDGFMGALDAARPRWHERLDNAVVLGAGGAGRSIVFALLGRGISNVHVVNRSIKKVENMQEAFGDDVKPAHWDDVPTLLKKAGLLVNATPLGMVGNPELNIDLTFLAEDAIVSDIVYFPLRTPLLVAADALGLTTSNGLSMLLHQAVRGFELWFGLRPEVTQEQYNLMAKEISKN
jgi:shikimate dehydrogenase